MLRSLLPPGRLAAAALACVMLLAAVPARAAEDADAGKLPRFASLDAPKVYLREGPTYKNRILWVYHRKHLPVEIVAAFDVWRRVRMPDGALGWVHVALLSSARTVVVTGKANAPIREQATPGSRILALAAPGVIAKLGHCVVEACEISASGTDGWIDKTNIWGVHKGEGRR